jgi:hypothetical protein
MSIFKIQEGRQENFTLEVNPSREFSSSSSGITGSIFVYPRRSEFEKESESLSPFNATQFNDDNLSAILQNAVSGARNPLVTNIGGQMGAYLDAVNGQSRSARKFQSQSILRFEPSFTFTSDTLRKNVIRQTLFPFYRSTYADLQWGYTNYHCLNFFTASSVPSNSAILYPNSASYSAGNAFASGAYTLSGAFTFDFYINPKYTTDTEANEFKAGTIFHLSSSYAVSLVTGSSNAPDGRPNGYRVMLQLSHSADVTPSSIDLSIANNSRVVPNDLTFLSSDNSLYRNRWHHVAIRWGTNNIAQGSGSFFIDGIEKGSFNVPSASVAPAAFAGTQGDPDVLVIGNYYNSPNDAASNNLLAGYFAKTGNSGPAYRDGLMPMFVDAGASLYDYGPTGSLDHPLNAEVHDLKIYDIYRSTNQILSSGLAGPRDLANLKFYVPPYFTKESPVRKVQAGNTGNEGGVMQTPFFGIDSSTDDPFNVALSFGVGGHNINAENFGRDLATGIYPRWLGLTGSTITTTSELLSCNQFLYATSSVRKRNLTILPCDNGKFVPNFSLLASGAFSLIPVSGSITANYTNDLGVLDYSLITLNDLIPTSTLRPGLIAQSGSIFDSIAGASPDNLGVDPGEVLTIFQRTRDNSSNEISFFDMSNLYYGNAIKSGSFSIADSAISGSGDKVSITLRDNGNGGLYRADCLSKQATWNNVGNIIYEEGIIVVKSPNIPFFGKDQFTTSFKGSQNIHTLTFSVVAPGGMLNSSSNPQYKPLSASLNANDKNSEFVYIDGINFHDENLNVIMKTKFAQPIVKRHTDKIMFKPKLDF